MAEKGTLAYYLGPHVTDALNRAGTLAWMMSPADDYQYATEGFNKMLAPGTLTDRLAGFGQGMAGTLAFALPGVTAGIFDDATRAGIKAAAESRPARAVDDAMSWVDEQGRMFYRDQFGGIRVWHGSPHDFEKFRMSQIGTGEGAQAYGHGLYFAESPGVARSYQQQLAMNKYNNDRNYSKALEAGLSAGEFDQFESLARQTIRDPDVLANAFFDWNDAWRPLRGDPAEYKNIRDFAESYLEELPTGHLYEAMLNAELEDFLDWDAPLTDIQVDKLVDAAQSQMGPEFEELADYYKYGGAEDTGRTAYSWMANTFDKGYMPDGVFIHTPQGKPAVWTQEVMRDAGIPGITYLDQGSRAAGEGTRNFVVFDEDIIDLVGKDEIPMLRNTR